MKSKHDPNYLAAVERAIAEKYGKNTVQDFRNEWAEEKEKDYLEQLKDRAKVTRQKTKKQIVLENGSVEVKRPNKQQAADRTCPVCKTYSFSPKDDLYMNRFQSCYSCYVDFIEDRTERWATGWRPDKEHLETCLRRRNNGNSPRRN